MLVPAMNHEEIAAQVNREYHKIYHTTLLRLGAEYDRERRKLRINKEDSYPKEYEIKTAGKNNWIIFIHKGPGVKKYTGTMSLSFLCIVYYYCDKGLRVYWPATDEVLAGFTSHFFKRYNERLRLNLSNPIDIVKAFFRKGIYCTVKVVARNNKPHIIAFGVDGLRFGEIKYNYTYVEWKTFVNREITFPQQDELELELSNDLVLKLKEAEKQEAYDPITVMSLKNRVVALPLPSGNTG